MNKGSILNELCNTVLNQKTESIKEVINTTLFVADTEDNANIQFGW